MAQMTAAACTHFLRADHSIAAVAHAANVRLLVRPEEARPAGARIELRVRSEQRQSAEAAGVCAITMIVEEHAAKGGLGAVLEQHTPLVGFESGDDLGALRFARRLQVELAHDAPPLLQRTCRGALIVRGIVHARVARARSAHECAATPTN